MFETVAAVLSTLAALVLVLAAAWLLLKWMGKTTQGQRTSRYITILDRIMVGQDKCLLLISVAGKKMLLGMSNGAVTKLCDIEDDADTIQAVEPQSFSNLLQSALGAVRKGKSE